MLVGSGNGSLRQHPTKGDTKRRRDDTIWDDDEGMMMMMIMMTAVAGRHSSSMNLLWPCTLLQPSDGHLNFYLGHQEPWQSLTTSLVWNSYLCYSVPGQSQCTRPGILAAAEPSTVISYYSRESGQARSWHWHNWIGSIYCRGIPQGLSYVV